MEQWVSDGREIVRSRGLSLIPSDAEELGFKVDMSGGLRGLLMKEVAKDKEGTSQSKEYPIQYAECEIRYIYKDTEGNIVDVHSEVPMMKNPSGVDGGVDVVNREELARLVEVTTLDVIAGAGQVTQGMDEAILQTARGETTEWWLDPAFAFRENGFRSKLGSIQADAPVYLKLTVVDFTNPMSSYERLCKGEETKNAANKLFNSYLTVIAEGGRKQDPTKEIFKDALRMYHRALSTIRKRFSYIPKPEQQQKEQQAATPSTEEEKVEQQATPSTEEPGVPSSSPSSPTPASSSPPSSVKKDGVLEPSCEDQMAKDTILRSVLFNNLATMHYVVGNYTLSDSFVTKSLQVSPRYDKALFRKALILIHHDHNFAQGSHLLHQMKKDSIGDAGVITAKLEEVAALRALYEAKSKSNAKGMFKGVGN